MTVEKVIEVGVIVRLEGNGCRGFITSDHAKGAKLDAGKVVTARILDVDRIQGIFDLTLKSFVPGKTKEKGGKKSKKGAKSAVSAAAAALAETPATGTNDATIELVKEDYLVLSNAAGQLMFALSKRTNDQRTPFSTYKYGKTGVATVLKSTHADRTLCTFEMEMSAEDAVNSKGQSGKKVDMADLAVGKTAQAKVIKIHKLQMNLDFGGKVFGRVHVSEAGAAKSFRAYTVGDMIDVVVIGTYSSGSQHSSEDHKRTMIEASVKEDKLSGKTKLKPLPSWTTLKVGAKLGGVVSSVNDEMGLMYVFLAPGLRLRVWGSQASADPAVVEHLSSGFAAGDVVSCSVISCNADERTGDVTLLPTKKGKVAGKYSPGDLVVGFVRDVPEGKEGNGVHIQISSKQFGSVALTEIADKYKSNPMKRLKSGAAVQCRVMELPEGRTAGKRLDLSLRPSVVNGVGEVADARLTTIADVKEGGVYRGYITNATDNGVFVTLGMNITARVQIRALSDLFIKDFRKTFTVGKLVKGRVTSMDAETRRIEMNLKGSIVDPENFKAPITLQTLKADVTVRGTVKRVESFGVFVAVDNSEVVGLAHISECSEKFIKDLASVYSAGDRVKAKVLKVEGKKLSLGLKPSYFDEEEDSDSEDDEDDGEDGEDGEDNDGSASEEEDSDDDDDAEEDGDAAAAAMDESEDDSVDEEDDGESDDEEADSDDELVAAALAEADAGSDSDEDDTVAATLAKADGNSADEEEDEESDDEDEDEDEDDDDDDDEEEEDSDDESEDEDEVTFRSPEKADRKRKRTDAPTLDVKAGFSWGDDDDVDGDDGDDGEGAGSSSSEDDDEDQSENVKKKLSKRAKRAAKVADEEKTRAEEEAMVDDSTAPQSAEAFDRMLLGSPNSSYIWVKYIAFHLQMTEIEKARKVGERALKAISIREEGERMNIWIARLNLENSYGTKESLATVFDLAQKMNDSMKTHVNMASIFQRSEKYEEAEELFAAMCKKFRGSPEVWIRYVQLY